MRQIKYCIETDKNTLYVDEDVFNYVVSLEQQIRKQKKVINKAVKYISDKKAIINTDVIRIFDLFEIDEQGYTDELLKILKEK